MHVELNGDSFYEGLELGGLFSRTLRRATNIGKQAGGVVVGAANVAAGVVTLNPERIVSGVDGIYDKGGDLVGSGVKTVSSAISSVSGSSGSKAAVGRIFPLAADVSGYDWTIKSLALSDAEQSIYQTARNNYLPQLLARSLTTSQADGILRYMARNVKNTGSTLDAEFNEMMKGLEFKGLIRAAGAGAVAGSDNSSTLSSIPTPVLLGGGAILLYLVLWK